MEPGNHARDHFLDLPEGEIVVKEEEIPEAERWDGLRGIVTRGRDEADPQELLARFERLRQIEAWFPGGRQELENVSAFHWTERRIRAHVAICYMAHRRIGHLRLRLAMIDHPMSVDEIVRELGTLEFVVVARAGTDGKHVVPTSAPERVKQICRSLWLTWSTMPFRMTSTRRARSVRNEDRQPA